MDFAPESLGYRVNAPRRRGSVFIAIHVVLPIAAGAALYSLWRSNKLLVFTWCRWLHLTEVVYALRASVHGAKGSLPGFILYSLPDGLWVYSFTALLMVIWEPHRHHNYRWIWQLLPLALTIGAEVGQWFGVVPGTFDWADIAAYSIAWVLALLAFWYYHRPDAYASSTRRVPNAP